MKHGWLGILLGASAIPALASTARAGGLEVPDVGSEALGRGGAFTAKADDATAFSYNIAGFARQRGTRVLLNANLTMSSYDFQRAGAYPDSASDPHTPWGGALFPKVTNQGGPFFAPYVGLSTDFGYFDRLTFAIGAYGPSGVGNATYPLGVQGAPSPARYDIVATKTLVVLPTIAAAYRVTDDLDVGVAFHLPYGNFDLINVSSSDLGGGLCANHEYQGCDSQNHLKTSGFTVAGSLGAMYHPTRNIAIGANVRTPFTLNTSGTVDASAPAAIPTAIPQAAATFSTSFPLVLRGGARYIFWDGDFEKGDIELDGTFEGWSAAQGTGPIVDIPVLQLPQGPTHVHTVITHGYGDTFSIRAGGAYNFPALGGVVTLRAGAYYDATATNPATTRLDFNTLEKYAGTLGIGFRTSGGLTFNIGYAEVFSPGRVVTNGTLQPINGLKSGQSIDANGQPLPVVNNGTYDAHMRIISFGMSVVFDEVLGSERYKRVTTQHAPPPEPEAKPAEPVDVDAAETKRYEEEQKLEEQKRIAEEKRIAEQQKRIAEERRNYDPLKRIPVKGAAAKPNAATPTNGAPNAAPNVARRVAAPPSLPPPPPPPPAAPTKPKKTDWDD